MKHTKLYSVLLLVVLFWLGGTALLSARDADEAKELVSILRQFLAYDPGTAPQGAEVSPAEIQARKNEIQSQITAVLQSTRRTYTCNSYDFTVNNYVISKGALSITDDNLNHTMWIKMTQAQGDAVTRNPGDFRLEAQQELGEDFHWIYYNWVLKGSSTIYYEEQPEPVNTIPKPGAAGPGNDPEADITVYYIEKDQPAQEAIRQLEDRNVEASLEYFETVANSPRAHPESFYWAAMNYITAGYPDTALMWLKKYLDSGNQTYAAQAAEYYRILTDQKRVFVQSSVNELPEYLATTYGERHFVLSPDGQNLYFSAYREDNPDQMDIWRSARMQDQWTRPLRVSALSTKKDEALCSFSSNGSRAYLAGLYKPEAQDWDIYYSDKGSADWQKPVRIGAVSSTEQDIDPWVFDDYLMLFSSNRPGGFGGYDLYYSLSSAGAWQAPVNLGPGINTSGDECSPFIDWDGKTLFFCSNGRSGLGGADLYKVVILDPNMQSYSYPENLGAPINSIFNDRLFYHSKNSNKAFLISDRGRNKVENLFSANLVYSTPGYYIQGSDGQLSWVEDTNAVSPLTGLKFAQLEDLPELVLTGSVTDDKQNPLAAQLDLSYTSGLTTYQYTARSDKSGQYSLSLPRAESYSLDCNLRGYRKYSVLIEPVPGADMMLHNVVLEPLEVGRSYIYENILFDYDVAVIRSESFRILDDMTLTLLSNARFRAEIAGHTCDNQYTAKRDLELSQQRADAVVDYLVGKGVERSRLVAKGYGRTMPIAENETEAGKQKNRRVELKILEK